MKKYQIIYADPPWSYGRTNCYRAPDQHYPVMTIKDIEALPISNLADKDCILFMWTPYITVVDAINIAKEWGFKFITIGFVWVKKNKKADSWFWGMGNWTRANSEICLIFTKGKPKRVCAGVHSVLDDRVMKHSQKPQEARIRIEKLMGDLPRIELFAREKTPGWDVWGNEVESDIEL